MKKILIAAIALFIGSGAFAQDVRVGIKAGANLSTVTSAPVDTKMKLGFHIGGFLEFKFSDVLSLQPELLYSTQGAKYVFIRWYSDVQFGNVSDSRTIDYINVPVLLKINITEGFSAEIGPQIGFLIGTRWEKKRDGVLIESGSIMKICNTVDVTALAGLSYAFAENFIVSARYGLGLTKILSEEGNSKNSVIQLSVGYKF